MKRAAIIVATILALAIGGGVVIKVKKCPPAPVPAGPEAPKTMPPVAVPVAPAPPVNVATPPSPTVAEAKSAEVAK